MTRRPGDESHPTDHFSGCPSENELLDLVEGRLEGGAAERAREHLLSCNLCQDIVAEVAGAGSPGGQPRVRGAGDRVGRYVVQRIVGAGAMGVVYEAHDPELARRVALKLVRTDRPGGSRAEQERLRARLLREAQAMARLSHPNVIPVFDVGFDGAEVFVAMELVAGGTLSAYLRGGRRDSRRVLSLFVEAGRGLAAAHAAGLVHRDFKPDNALVGEDGRARVTDFGLALVDGAPDGGAPPAAPTAESLTGTGVLVGTPAYMAPEQLAGGRYDHRADIFAYSVSLFEGLGGARPFEGATIDELRSAIERGAVREPPDKIPARISAILRRGMAADPDRRWPSVETMLRELEREPRAMRVALSVGALTLLVAGAAAFARPAAVCEGAEQAWGQAWSDGARAKVRAAFGRGGPGGALAATAIEAALDRRRGEWVQQHTDSCRATRVRGEQSEQVLDAKMACLADKRRETAALVALLIDADEALIERGASPVKGLSSLEECRYLRPTSAPVVLAPHEREAAGRASDAVAAARARRAAGRYADGVSYANKAVEIASALPDLRLRTQAFQAQGLLLEEAMRYPEAEASYHAAVKAALSAHDDGAAADAWMQLAGIAGYRREQVAEAHMWLAYADTALSASGSDVPRRARYHERLSLIEWSLDANLDEANRHYAISLALERGLPEAEASRFLEEHGPIQFDMGRYDVAERIFARDVERITSEKGEDHPEMLEAAENLAEVRAMMGRPAEAIPVLRSLLAKFPDRAAGYTNHRLADALRRAGDIKRALEEDERAIAAEEGPANALARAPGLHGKGHDLLLLGRPRESLEPLERAASIRKAAKLATIRAETDQVLARALVEAGGDRARARSLAESARKAYAEAAERHGSRWYAAEASSIASWLAKTPP